MSPRKKKPEAQPLPATLGTHPLKQIRRAAVPLVAWESYDPAATIAGCQKALNGDGSQVPILAWDCVQGLVGINDAGNGVIPGTYEPGMPLHITLPLLKFNPQDAKHSPIVFIHNAHKFFEYPEVLQAIWLCRDAFKPHGATLILFWMGGKLPAEIGHDVIEIGDEAPSPEVILDRCEQIIKPFNKPDAPYAWNKEETVSGLRGLLSLFDVEQTLCLSMSKAGVDVQSLWNRKIKRLRGSTGAEITIDNPDFSELSGCENVKQEIQGFIQGRQKPGVVLFLDEIEKSFGGAGTDLSGTTTNMLGQFLTWTQDKRARGFLLCGIPGAGKSWTGACAAGQAGVPFFKLNVSETKGSLVGQSEQQMKSALAAVDAIAGGGSVLLIASCNWVDSLPPEVMSRFTMGTYFYDYPDDKERDQLLEQYAAKYELDHTGSKDWLKLTRGWVGREIENACYKAWQFNRSFVEVAVNIAPSCISQAAKLEKLRNSCSNRFLSASKPGLYKYEPINLSAAPVVGGAFDEPGIIL